MPLAATTAQTGGGEKQSQYAGRSGGRQSERAQMFAGEVNLSRADDILQAGLFGEIDFK